MKLTIKLKDGSQETAYLSDDTLKFLQNTIMDECDCEDIDSIDDWDYVDYAIMMNDELRIFKKKYKEMYGLTEEDEKMPNTLDYERQKAEGLFKGFLNEIIYFLVNISYSVSNSPSNVIIRPGCRISSIR